MALVPGTRLGAYEVTALLGQGGMGEVYRARDTKLDREVAIKVLPESFAGDSDRLMRFEREAKTLAALNHPHIAQIHGFEQSPSTRSGEGGFSALVMELVEGEDLAARIARGPMPVDDALPIARQIAEALEAAHEQGIVHRDLKPANIKVRDDGTVKVLDFGLAKALAQGPGPKPQADYSPTITSPAMTQAGIILGTAAYMAPEQARGRPVDRRADLWAFGCVLFEMLTGRRPFGGEDVTETLAQIVMRDPDWSLLPAGTPPAIRRLLTRCLEKDPRRRLDSAAAARLDIDAATAPEQMSGPTPAVGHGGRGRWAGWIVAALSTTALLAVLASGGLSEPEPTSVALEVPTTITTGGGGQAVFAVSPDGSRIATRIVEEGQAFLSVRRLDQFTSVTLPGSDEASRPFWSPDSRSVAYFAKGRLLISSADGGAPEAVPGVSVTTSVASGAWGPGGDILLGVRGQPITRVSVAGGTPTSVTSLDASRGERSHVTPRFLPDGRRFLYLAISEGEPSAIFVGSLDSTPPTRLVAANVQAEFAEPDLLLYLREDTLTAQRLDLARLTLVGDPMRVAGPVFVNAPNGIAGISVSDNGVLMYRPGGGMGLQAAWVDRSGTIVRRFGMTGDVRNVSLSPDGRLMALHGPAGGGDIWITDLERGTDTRFTLDPAMDNNPVWSPDGRRLAFVSNRDGGVFNIYTKNAGGTGSEELILKTANHKRLGGWSSDGAYLLYDELGPKGDTDIWRVPLAGARQPERLIAGPVNEGEPALSPDGRWLAYASDESGLYQVYVQPFPTGDRKWRVSSSPATVGHPRWSPTGRELFFDASGQLTVVSFTGTRDGIIAGREQRLFGGLSNLPPHTFDVAPDGQHIMALLGPQGAANVAPPLRVVTNWTRLLAK
jgi:serine/threonine protein kinase/Tol biopolymer transport system component